MSKLNNLWSILDQYKGEKVELLLKPGSKLAYKANTQKVVCESLQQPLTHKYEEVVWNDGTGDITDQEISNIGLNLSPFMVRRYNLSDDYVNSLYTDGIPIDDILKIDIVYNLPS